MAIMLHSGHNGHPQAQETSVRYAGMPRFVTSASTPPEFRAHTHTFSLRGNRSTYGRSAGFTFRSCATSAADSLPRCTGTGMLGFPERTIEMSAWMVSASNGSRDDRRAYRMTPHDHMSDFDAS
eukprot:scaffold16013_cov27-Tisochrysis_lutea.AAC.2